MPGRTFPRAAFFCPPSKGLRGFCQPRRRAGDTQQGGCVVETSADV